MAHDQEVPQGIRSSKQQMHEQQGVRTGDVTGITTSRLKDSVGGGRGGGTEVR